MLIAHERRNGGSASSKADPVVRALSRAVAELSRWVGANGCRALLTRALANAAREHRALAGVQVTNHPAATLAGVKESIAAHGDDVVATSLTTTLEQLFELLGRVIGDDLTLKLAEQITTGDATGTAPRGDVEEPA